MRLQTLSEARWISIFFCSDLGYDRGMKRLLPKILSFVILFAIAGLTGAAESVDYRAYKSADGVLIVSERARQLFSINVPGHKIHLIGPNELYVLGNADAVAHHPYMMVDGRLVQIMPVPIAEFKGNATAQDELILRQQAEYELSAQGSIESNIKSILLPSRRKALLYSCRVRDTGPGSENQLFITLRENDYVLVLNSNVPKGEADEKVKSFLIRVASSFRASKTPIRPAAQPYRSERAAK